MSVAKTEVPRFRVLLVDDQWAFRMAARSVLEADDAYVVVGEATDGESAVALALCLRPNVILMDVRLPGINGIEATRQILAGNPTTTVVLLSTHRGADLPADLLDCGAAGFVPKESLDPAVLARLLAEPS